MLGQTIDREISLWSLRIFKTGIELMQLLLFPAPAITFPHVAENFVISPHLLATATTLESA